MTEKMLDEWRKSVVVPIYKTEGEIQKCTNSRGVKLMSCTTKLWERAMDQRPRKKSKIFENQFGFILGRSLMEAISHLGN